MAHRIASLLASGTEILHGLGLDDRVVAISHECDFPPEIVHKPRVTCANIHADLPSGKIDEEVKQFTAAGRALYSIDTQLLACLKPDLIVTQSQCEVCAVSYEDVRAAVRSIPTLHDTRIVALNPTSLDEVLIDVQRVADAAEVPERGRAFVGELRARIEGIARQTQKIPHDRRPRVACIEWIEPVMLGANWMPDLISLAGAHCELTVSGAKSHYTPWSAVVAFDPEVIVVMPCGFDLDRTIREAPVLQSFDRWHTLNAVRNGRVFAVDGNALFNRSGPRLVDSLELLAHLVQPTLFPSPPASCANAFRRIVAQ